VCWSECTTQLQKSQGMLTHCSTSPISLVFFLTNIVIGISSSYFCTTSNKWEQSVIKSDTIRHTMLSSPSFRKHRQILRTFKLIKEHQSQLQLLESYVLKNVLLGMTHRKLSWSNDQIAHR